jgi:hypothetical protein
MNAGVIHLVGAGFGVENVILSLSDELIIGTKNEVIPNVIAPINMIFFRFINYFCVKLERIIPLNLNYIFKSNLFSIANFE